MPLLIQCPFYINEKRLKTFCEGGTLKSPDLRYRREFLMDYCASEEGWRTCTIAKSLDKYYCRSENEN